MDGNNVKVGVAESKVVVEYDEMKKRLKEMEDKQWSSTERNPKLKKKWLSLKACC